MDLRIGTLDTPAFLRTILEMDSSPVPSFPGDPPMPPPGRPREYDVFISHASEDKEEVALPVARLLEERGLRVWLDEFELTLGDSLRRAIDHGLRNSRFGVVVLSPDFLRKEWPARELDALLAREEDGGKVILPVWHRVSHADLVDHSPLLAGRLSISTSRGLDAVADAIQRAASGTISPSRRGLSFDEQIARELSAIRRGMLGSNSHHDLEQSLYVVEEILQRHPGHPEARMLRQQLHAATEFSRPSPSPGAPYAYPYPAARSAPRRRGFLALALAVLLAIALLALALLVG